MKHLKFTVIPQHLFALLSESAQKEIAALLEKENSQFEVDCKRASELEQRIDEDGQRLEVDGVKIDWKHINMIAELETLRSARSQTTDCEVFAALLMGQKITARAWPEGSFIEIGDDGDLIDENGEAFSDLNALVGFKMEAIL